MESKRIFKGKHDELQSRLVSDFIGNTPFVRLSDKIYAKLESVNPGGSIKDRPVKWILDDAEDNKLIKCKVAFTFNHLIFKKNCSIKVTFSYFNELCSIHS